MEMKFYGIIGQSVCVCATRPSDTNQIEMEGPNKKGGVAQPDGTWSDPVPNPAKDHKEYIDRHYSQEEQMRIILNGTEEERESLRKLMNKADEKFGMCKARTR